MTKKIIARYSVFLAIALTVIGVASAHASKVTGALPSSASNNAQASGNIGATVSGGSSNDKSSSGSTNGGNSSNAPQGSVLGTSMENVQTPGSPNAGFAPEGATPVLTAWSAVIAFIKDIIPF